jgi:Ca2+-binding EF-hand superfamily protein
MRLTDPLIKRRVFIASLYREVDILLQGAVKRVQFEKIYDALVDKDYINPKKHKLVDVFKRVDSMNKGKIEMNRFVTWMDEVSFKIAF